MKRTVPTRSAKAGLPPGSLVHVGEEQTEPVTIEVIDYGPDQVEETAPDNLEDCARFVSPPTVTWINVNGSHCAEIVEQAGQAFQIHPLVLEDILNTEHRPKVDDYDTYLYLTLRMLTYDEKAQRVDSEQVSLVLGPSYVLSFQERKGDVFDPLRERIRRGKGRVRQMGTDYLAYSLIDVIVDQYFALVERLSESIDEMEERLLEAPEPETLRRIHDLWKETIFLQKSIWPLRDLIDRLQKGEHALISKRTMPFLRDVSDHTIHVMETLETFQQVVNGILSNSLTVSSNRMNQVMTILAIFATIFMPMTFLVGVYGMNFTYMPELQWRWGYPAVLLVILITAVGMLIFFKKRKWF